MAAFCLRAASREVKKPIAQHRFLVHGNPVTFIDIQVRKHEEMEGNTSGDQNWRVRWPKYSELKQPGDLKVIQGQILDREKIHEERATGRFSYGAQPPCTEATTTNHTTLIQLLDALCKLSNQMILDTCVAAWPVF